MTPEQTKLIQDLAEKLGTTAEHLWQVLVAQAPISAAAALGMGVFLFLLLFVAVGLLYKVMKEEDCEMEPFGFFGGIAVAALLIVCCVCAGNLDMVLAGFFNPEYWALKQIMK